MRRVPLLSLESALTASLACACGGGGGGGQGSPAGNPSPASLDPGVAYLADQDVDDRFELYVADLDGDGAVKVSGPLAAGGDVTAFAWSPDRTRLAFLADKDADQVFELYVVGLSGTPTKVSGPLVAGGDVTEFAWSPDSSRLACRADAETDEAFELYVGAADGSSWERVSVAATAGHGVPRAGFTPYFQWAPDGSRLAWVSDEQTPDTLELFTVRPDGSARVRASGAMVPSGEVFVETSLGQVEFAWAPDSSAVADIADQEADGVNELFRSAADGSGNVKISAPLAAMHTLIHFAWAPDASRLAYLQYGVTGTSFDGSVDVTAPDGTAHVTVSTAVPFPSCFLWSPDSTRIVYAAPTSTFDRDSPPLHVVASDGTGHVALGIAANVPLLIASLHTEVLWAPASDRLAIRPTFSGGLITLRPDGSDIASVSIVIPALIAWAPNGSAIAYSAAQDNPRAVELYVSHPDTLYGSLRVSTPLLAGQNARLFGWTADSARLVYRADADGFGALRLFAVGRFGGESVPLTPLPVFGGGVTDFELR